MDELKNACRGVALFPPEGLACGGGSLVVSKKLFRRGLPMHISRLLSTLGFALILGGSAWAAPKYKALIVDGQNNHAWQQTTPLLKRALESSGLFTVEVATSPPQGSDLSGFKPDFASYDVVVSNYNGEPWAGPTMAAFEKYVREGGGFVSVHAANNSFPAWKEYNRMIGLGGWGDRDERWGPYVRFRDGKIALGREPGRGGSHGTRHSFQVILRDTNHPITAGLSAKWMHAEDELYDRLRGPAENMTLLATAYSDPATKGTGEHEPMLMVVDYGNGRVFHTTLGHDAVAMSCVGFITTLQRGAEWAAGGKVTQKAPPDFPTADRVSTRE
jgi:type 1 glutamine amidotransferase